MSVLYYKFKSENRGFQTIAFDGMGLAVGEVKRHIVQQNKLALGPDHALSVVDSQTGEGGRRVGSGVVWGWAGADALGPFFRV
jgi:hypothetical protein